MSSTGVLVHTLAAFAAWIIYFIAISQAGYMAGNGCRVGIYQSDNCRSLIDTVKDIDLRDLTSRTYAVLVMAGLAMGPLTGAVIAGICWMRHNKAWMAVCALHAASCLFVGLTWILMVALFEYEASSSNYPSYGRKVKFADEMNLNYGFAFIVLVSVIEVVLTGAAFMLKGNTPSGNYEQGTPLGQQASYGTEC
eukprot:TRINITY_DN87_c0_g3_i5.p1 TRINITY_DN87_c0_g3~~TRINITY_DN87_c0_g3_i5.p1  ORF type:complete len:213 (+),score=49.06 TRINITY_DN87_c0_g3_i5:58-639(+)